VCPCLLLPLLLLAWLKLALLHGCRKALALLSPCAENPCMHHGVITDNLSGAPTIAAICIGCMGCIGCQPKPMQPMQMAAMAGVPDNPMMHACAGEHAKLLPSMCWVSQRLY
jgi:hypothetical protein